VFSNHDKRSPPARVGCHHSRRVKASIDDPDRPYHPPVTPLSLRRYVAIDNIFLAVNGIDHLHDVPDPGDGQECANQRFRILAREAEQLEELRLAAIVWMASVQEVLTHLVLFHDREVRVSKLHAAYYLAERSADHAGRGCGPLLELVDWACACARPVG
jgi:hypothetical protein